MRLDKLTRTPIENEQQNVAELRTQTEKLNFVKEIRESDPAEIETFRNAITNLAQQHLGDDKFQILVIDYLLTALRYLEVPTIIDSFGDSPENHVSRRIAIQEATRGNPSLNAYLEDQKLSRSRIGSTLTIFAENLVPALYPPPNSETSSELQSIAAEAEELKYEVEQKFSGLEIIPLSEKETVINKAVDVIKRGIIALLKTYGSKDANLLRNVR